MAASTGVLGIKEWLRHACDDYRFDISALLRQSGKERSWPVTLNGKDDLWRLLGEDGYLLPLPSESGALANIIEVSLVDYLLRALEALPGVHCRRGTTRGYPDLEISGPVFGGGYHAIDIKAARRNASLTRTVSRITLYTGNTYFRRPDHHYPGMFRPFGAYESHLDIVALFTFAEHVASRVTNLQLVVHEPWRIASRRRSSNTRNYIGAVTSLARLVQGQGEFISADEFYDYWRAYDFDAPEPRHPRKAKDPGAGSEQMALPLG